MKLNFTPEQIARMTVSEAGRHLASSATALENSGGIYKGDFHRAWHDAETLNPELAAHARRPAGALACVIIGTTAALPGGASGSAQDGQDLTTGWPVTKDVLAKMGLPEDATAAEYNLFRRAANVKLTPDVAAVVLKTTIQALQLQHATTFKDAMALLKQRFPEIHAAALEAGKAQ